MSFFDIHAGTFTHFHPFLSLWPDRYSLLGLVTSLTHTIPESAGQSHSSTVYHLTIHFLVHVTYEAYTHSLPFIVGKAFSLSEGQLIPWTTSRVLKPCLPIQMHMAVWSEWSILLHFKIYLHDSASLLCFFMGSVEKIIALMMPFVKNARVTKLKTVFSCQCTESRASRYLETSSLIFSGEIRSDDLSKICFQIWNPLLLQRTTMG